MLNWQWFPLFCSRFLPIISGLARTDFVLKKTPMVFNLDNPFGVKDLLLSAIEPEILR